MLSFPSVCTKQTLRLALAFCCSQTWTQIKGTTCFPFGSVVLCFRYLSHLAQQSDLNGKGSVGRKALMASATFGEMTVPQFNTGEFKTQRSQEWSKSIKDKLYLLEIKVKRRGKEFHSPFQTVAMPAMHSRLATMLDGKTQHLNATWFPSFFLQLLGARLAW